jgi:anthranilate synthase component 1
MPECFELPDNQFDILGLHSLNPEDYPHFLESVVGGRYDILFAFPQERLSCDSIENECSYSFLERLDQEISKRSRPAQTGLPFEGGWFVFLSYELAQSIEPVLKLSNDPSGLPVAELTRFPAAVVHDRETHIVTLVAETKDQLSQLRNDFEQSQKLSLKDAPVVLEGLEEDEPNTYLAGVERIRDYIVEGDVFQVNLSRAWQGKVRTDLSHSRLYAALRKANPAPFAALMTRGDQAVISSSPERLVSVSAQGVIQTRPIAGTRPRSADQGDDEALSAELMAHPKERAEHIMLIDLERNDLGRVCEPGSVEVNELMVLESYAHVHHIVSNVRGRVRADATVGQIISAVFPGGTITGCPKVRCMEIIAELEHEGRGAYTGSLGYINCDGATDLNILIRTLVRNGEEIRFRTGAGIVADSIPKFELEETRHKAKGLLRGFAHV